MTEKTTKKSDIEYLKISIEKLQKHAGKHKSDKSMQRSLHTKLAKLMKLEKK